MAGVRHALVALVLAGTLAACSDDEPRPTADPSPSASDDATPAAPGASGDHDDEDDDNNGDDTGEDHEPRGSAGSPVVLDARGALLDWREVPGPADSTVTVSGDWTLTQGATEAVLEGPRGTTVEAPSRHRVTDTLIDAEYAVVVTEDEQARQPNTATVIDLATGETSVLDGRSDVPTTSGDTWALGQGRLVHATIGPGRAYCAATVELATMISGTTWCAPRRHGFSSARMSPAGTSLLVFDDGQPSCRTVGRIDTGELAPFEGVPDCTGWDAALLDGGAVWSVVPQERRIEEALFYARSDDGWFDLGPGTSGSLTWCGGSAYFVRDPQQSSDPARLMSWSPGSGLGVAYETEARGRAFLTQPRCGGTDLTIAALTPQGDRQVTASVV